MADWSVRGAGRGKRLLKVRAGMHKPGSLGCPAYLSTFTAHSLADCQMKCNKIGNEAPVEASNVSTTCRYERLFPGLDDNATTVLDFQVQAVAVKQLHTYKGSGVSSIRLKRISVGRPRAR